MEGFTSSRPASYSQGSTPSFGLAHHLCNDHLANISLRFVFNKSDLYHECHHTVTLALDCLELTATDMTL